MHARRVYALFCGVVALGLAGTLALPADASGHSVDVAYRSAGGAVPPITDKTCYTQRDDDNGTGVNSQNYEPGLDAYDSQGADDFSVHKKKCITGRGPSTQTVRLVTIAADGQYINGPGPADSFNVTYYKDNGGTPGSVVKACRNASYTDPEGTGDPVIRCNAKLKPGTYWVSIQANMAFDPAGQWMWNTNNTVRGAASQWQNPGDGFGTGCTTYSTTTTCIPAGEGGDFSFSVSTKSK